MKAVDKFTPFEVVSGRMRLSNPSFLIGLSLCLMLVAMGICGLWHGLSWHYLLWGLYHGALLAVESLMAHVGFAPLKRLPSRVYMTVKVFITFCLVTFGWILFRYTMSDFVIYMKGMVAW